MARLTIDVEQQVDDVLAVVGIEIAGRLVGQQHLGLVRECPREGDTLLLAARQLRRVVVHAGVETHFVQQGAWHAACASFAPASSIGTSTFSNAVSEGIRWKNWKTKPINRPRRRASASSPRLVISRAVDADLAGRRRVEARHQTRASVLLPLPEGPTIARLRPAGIVRSSGWRMVRGDPPLSTVFETPCNSIMWWRGRV